MQTAVEYLKEKLMYLDFDPNTLVDVLEFIEKAKQMEKEKEWELKAFWFGRGILAGKEDRINELKPIKNQ